MLANKDRIDYLRALAGKKNVKYLRRGSRVSTAALGAGVKMQILAPEADASVYYKRDPRLWLAVAARLGSDGRGRARRRRSAPPVSARGPRAPEQMAPDEFAQLREQIAALDLADLLAIDKAANNTSLVVRLTVHDKVLLFPGDAEEESWAEMRSRNLLRPVDFLKIAHHGSVNGMPFEGGGERARPGREAGQAHHRPGEHVPRRVRQDRGDRDPPSPPYGDARAQMPHRPYHAGRRRLRRGVRHPALAATRAS
jgi:hypothetical protein